MFKVAVFLFILLVYGGCTSKNHFDGVWYIEKISYRIYKDTIPYYGDSIGFLNSGFSSFPSREKPYEVVEWSIDSKNKILYLTCLSDSIYNGNFQYKLYEKQNEKYLNIESETITLTAIKQELSIGKNVKMLSWERVPINALK